MKLPESQHTTSYQIMRWYESKPQEHRPHMGASLIGHQCDRNIWLTWRWALKPEFSGRILRLFDTGKREEARLIEELRGIGAQVWENDPNTGDQFRVVACNGHFGGSLDGVAKGLPEAPKSAAVLEFKTHSSKSYADLVAKKVRESKPQHFDQMTVYMGLMEIDRALYMAVNKDTDDVYTEWVHFDKERYDVLLGRAQRLIDAPYPPEKLSTDPAFYVCKMCNFWKHCHGGQSAEANCRTCCHATPVENAAWRCQLDNQDIELELQRVGCQHHLLIPALVPYGEPIDGGATWVAYKHRTTGGYFVNGTEEVKDYGPVFTSQELHACAGPLVGEMAAFKNTFPGSKVVSGSVAGPEVVEPTPEFVDPMPDLVSDDIDAIPVKPDTSAQRETRRKNKSFVDAMKKFGSAV